MNPVVLVITGRHLGPVPDAGCGIALGRGVESDSGDLDERVPRIRVDRDPLPGAVPPQLSNWLESMDTLSMPAACSTYETVPEQSYPASFQFRGLPRHVWLEADLVARPDHLLDLSGASAGAYASPWMILPVVPGTVGRGNGSRGGADPGAA